jgi:outer membrane protein assembly factor BamB/predicted phosphodiesterase
MKIVLTLLLHLIVSVSSFCQNYSYAWITDIHIGSPGADNDLRLVVNDINKRHDIKFVIATGDITEKGGNSELELARQILDSLKIPYHIIPGNHDAKWSESGCTKFLELWGDDKFQFDFQNVRHIGINSGIPWRGGGGHISVEDLDWLKNILDEVSPEREIIFYVHHPLDGDVDDWFDVTNLLSGHNVKAIFIGHGHANKLMNFAGIPSAMGRSTLSDSKFPGYTLVNQMTDSIKLFEVKVDSIPQLWGSIPRAMRNQITKVDSAQFIKYSNKAEVLWQKDLKKSVSTSLLVENNRIFSSSIDGILTCYDLKGNLIWQNNLSRTIFSRAAIADKIIAVATIEGDLITINSENGEIIQTLGLNETLTSQLVITETIYNDVKTKAIIAGTSSGKVYCYEMNSLELIWENNSAQRMIETLPLIIDEKIIYGSWDNYLYCISKYSGSLIWKWTENKNFYYSPAACLPVSDGKNVFVSTPDKFISAVDLSLGTTSWRKKDFNSWESIGISQDKKKIFVKSILDKFYIVSAADGKLIKEVKVGFSLDTMPNHLIDWNQNIIFGSKNGIVYLIDKNFSVYPLFFMGTSRVHSVQHITGNIFSASNMDGKIIVFKIISSEK